MAKAHRQQMQFAKVRAFVGGVYGADLHAKRIDSLAGATLGVMQSASLAVAMIGQALAQARGLITKHAIKQVDRLLSNHGIDVWDSFVRWVAYQIGERQDILVAMDWTEPQFRDIKDLRFGMGLSSTRIGEPMRRDRLLLVSAFATALLTLLGAVGESLGMDRLLKSNTSKARTHSLFRQGCMLYELIPNMPEHRLAPLIEKFAEAVTRTGILPAIGAMSK